MKRDISKHLFSDVRSIDGEGIAILPSSLIDVVPVLHTGSVPAMPPESPIVLNILDADGADFYQRHLQNLRAKKPEILK